MTKISLIATVAMLGATSLLANAEGWTSVPEDGATVESIGSLSLTYNGMTPTFKNGLELTDLSFQLHGADINFGTDLRSQPRFNGNTVTFPAPLEEGGKYTFHFDEGALTVTENGKKVNCPEANITLYIKGVAVEWNEPFSVFPPQDSRRQSMNGYTYVQFTDVASFTQADDFALECTSNGESVATPGRIICSGNTLLLHYDKTLGVMDNGEYELYSKAGNFLLTKTNGEIENSPEFTIKYTIASDCENITCTPTPGSAATLPLSSFKINTGTRSLAFGDEPDFKQFTVEIGNKVYRYGTDFFEDEDDISLFLFEKPLNIGGYATVNIPAGFFLLNGTPSPQYRWSFLTLHPQSTYTLTPADGSIVRGGVEQLSIKFDGDFKSISFNEDVATNAGLKIFAGDKTLTYPQDFSVSADDDVVITLKNKINTDCTVSVNVPENTFGLVYTFDDVVPSPLIEPSMWQFISSVTVAPTISTIPAAGSIVPIPFTSVKINYDKDLVKAIAISEEASRFDFVISVNGRYKYLGIGYDFDPDDPTVAILREPVEDDAEIEVEIEPGYYVMTLNNGSVALSNYLLSTFEVSHEAPAVNVDTLQTDETYNVSDLNGISIMKNVKAESLQSLSPGIYIINGKKVELHK